MEPPKAGRKKERIDVLLMERGLARSRTEAAARVLAGAVYRRTGPAGAGGRERVEKPGTALAVDVELEVEAPPRFVSRGGDKLEGALCDLAAAGEAVPVEGAVCLDVGASTGGFTDCLLQRGAKRVFAVDVGHGQLAHKLRTDPRVCAREGVNARELEAADFDEPVTLVVVDASFIGLGKLLGAIARVLARGGEARVVALVKPQFEVGREVAAKGRGVVRDEAEREAAIAAVRGEFAAVGMVVRAEVDSRVLGPKGNRERFLVGGW